MITIKIEEEKALELLLDRLQVWTGSNKELSQLYEIMYQSYIDGGCFDGCEFDPMVIVDNDFINYCQVLSKEDCTEEDWNKLIKLYSDGNRDISCETAEGYFDKLERYSFIEAMNDDNTLALMRW